MPSRRKTVQQKRKKPALPDGDEGKDLSADERQTKMELFLQDFDIQVKSRVELVRKEARKLCESIHHCYLMELMKLPKAMRDMKRSEFLEAGNHINAVSSSAADKVVDTMAQAITSTVVKRSQKTRTETICDTINEEGDENLTATTFRAKATGNRRGAVYNTAAKAPPSTAKTRRTKAAFKTPAMAKLSHSAWADTPMVTPKFDPRLPLLPNNMRLPQRGERIMSLAGSPLVNNHDKPHTEKILDLIEETDIEDIDLNSDTKENIAKLHAKLSKLLETK